jgi:hypothetical protein
VTSPADLVDDRFVDELDRSGYLTRLWGEQSPR